MAENATPLVSSASLKPLYLRWRRFGLKGKIVLLISSLLVLTAIFNVVLLYHFTRAILEEQLERRGTTLAINLSDVAAAELLAKNSLGLHSLTTKYARLEGVAYVFIKDAKNQIAAHSLGTFPPELEDPTSTPSVKRSAHRRTFIWRGKSVFETRMPILEGQVGSVHVGMWKDPIRSEGQRIVVPMIGFMAVILLVGIFLAFVLAPIIVRPLQGLRTVASRISRGDLDVTVRMDGEDEIGDLGSSLERMRASLKAAMNRLDAL